MGPARAIIEAPSPVPHAQTLHRPPYPTIRKHLITHSTQHAIPLHTPPYRVRVTCFDPPTVSVPWSIVSTARPFISPSTPYRTRPMRQGAPAQIREKTTIWTHTPTRKAGGPERTHTGHDVWQDWRLVVCAANPRRAWLYMINGRMSRIKGPPLRPPE